MRGRLRQSARLAALRIAYPAVRDACLAHARVRTNSEIHRALRTGIARASAGAGAILTPRGAEPHHEIRRIPIIAPASSMN